MRQCIAKVAVFRRIFIENGEYYIRQMTTMLHISQLMVFVEPSAATYMAPYNVKPAILPLCGFQAK